jgi:ATP-dependent Clp protease adaptor protein ClpS
MSESLQEHAEATPSAPEAASVHGAADSMNVTSKRHRPGGAKRRAAGAILEPDRAILRLMGSQENDRRNEHGPALVVEEARPEVARPPLYQVILLNDDFTPMDFVVVVLETFFSLDRERATQVMLHVHTRGKGVCGVFTREVAETKVTQVNEFSRTHQHPLLCTMEKA